MDDLFSDKDTSLHAHFVIDGVRHDATPYDLLQECMTSEAYTSAEAIHDIVDETIDPPPSSLNLDGGRNEDHLRHMDAWLAGHKRPFNLLYPEHQTKMTIACALIDQIWQNGHFRLGDLKLDLGWDWDWNGKPIGSMAAFYSSVQSASGYIYDLGLEIAGYRTRQSEAPGLSATVSIYGSRENEHGLPAPYSSRNPWTEDVRKVPECIPEFISDIWLIFIPFDTCSFKLGGSLLAEAYGRSGGAAPAIADPDYFIDCYEVVRELVEDGILLAGCTVGDGGVMKAAASCALNYGIDLDMKGMLSSYQTDDMTRMLFGEVPGVLIMIRDRDFDYIDSQFLLQDIAYYPIGTLSETHKGVSLMSEPKSGLADILASLMAQASEGED